MAGPLKGYQWTTRSSYEYLLGNYEDPQVMDSFCYWLQPGSVFYDLGANIGFYSLVANKIISTGKIYSFEPSPMSRRIFEQHIALNKKLMLHDSIRILPFAIADRKKEVRFSNDSNNLDGNTYISSPAVDTNTKTAITVNCYAIDDLLAEGYEKPGIIKIDVEGAELEVLKGAVNTLQQYKPFILLATHDCRLPGVKDACVKFLTGLGYTVQHTGGYNKQLAGLDDYIAIHPDRL